MDKMLIPIGVAYAQLLDDVRAVVRHELQQAAPQPSTAPAIEDLLSIREAAQLLGVTVQTVHDWKRRSILAYYKMGSRSYLKRGEVLAALQRYQRTGKSGKGVSRG